VFDTQIHSWATRSEDGDDVDEGGRLTAVWGTGVFGGHPGSSIKMMRKSPWGPM